MRGHALAWLLLAAPWATAAAQDRDRDGIFDAEDLCPDAPEDRDGVADFDGCPDEDADGDGIVDDYDLCPREAETVNGFEDEDGCPDAVGAELETLARSVYFETGSHALSAEARATIARVAALLGRHAEVELLRVDGFADARGDPDANRALSLRRAESVRDALAGAGVARARLDAAGHGALPGEAPEIQAQNRRASLVVTRVGGRGERLDPAIARAFVAMRAPGYRIELADGRARLRVQAHAPSWMGPEGFVHDCYAGGALGTRLILHCRSAIARFSWLARAGGGAVPQAILVWGNTQEVVRNAPFLECDADQRASIDGCVTADTPRRVVGADVGGSHVCALLDDGTVRCAGYDENGSRGRAAGDASPDDVASPVDALPMVVQVALGHAHACARMPSGRLACWGAGGYGQIGDPTYPSGRAAWFSPNVVSVVDLDAGRAHTCALTREGRVWCWGRGDDGQLGRSVERSAAPQEVPGVSEVIDVACGGDSSCALRRDGTVLCWGAEMGRRAPRPVRGVSGGVALVAGDHDACVLHEDGGLTCWGAIDGHRLGRPPNADPPHRVASPDLIPSRGGALGDGFLCSLAADGYVHCVGANGYGQLGRSYASDRGAVSGVGGAVAIAANDHRGCAVTATGALGCWGARVGAEGETRVARGVSGLPIPFVATRTPPPPPSSGPRRRTDGVGIPDPF